MNAQRPPASPSSQIGTTVPAWRERALQKSEGITDAWEVTKTYAGRIAEWVLFGCMVMNIIEILPGVMLWPAVSNLVLGMQVVMLDVGGFSLASMGQQAHEQGDEGAAKRASITGGLLIGIMIVTLLLVTVGLLWPDARVYTSMAEKGLILVRVVMTVVYGHVIHSLRRIGVHRQQTALSEVFTDLSQRISESEARLSEQCHELVNRTEATLAQQRGQLATEFAHVHQHMQEQLAAELANVQANWHEQVATELAHLHTRLQQDEETLARLARLAPVQASLHRRESSSTRETPVQKSKPVLHVVSTVVEEESSTSASQTVPSKKFDARAFVFACLHACPTLKLAEIEQRAQAAGQELSQSSISRYRTQFFTHHASSSMQDGGTTANGSLQRTEVSESLSIQTASRDARTLPGECHDEDEQRSRA